MRLRRRRGSADALEFDIAVPEGLTAQDPRSTTISVGALREAGGPVTLDEHVARVRDGVAWTVNVQLPWMSFSLRDGALPIVGTLRFRDAEP